MLTVISPAKSMDFKTPPSCDRHSQPAFLAEAETLVAALRTYDPEDLSSLMGISEKLTRLNHERFSTWRQPFTPENAKPAVFAYTGDVYQGLQAAALSPADLEFAQEHLRILSGLYGLLRPLDLIQPYRLEMGIPLPTEEGNDLYTFWKKRLTKALSRQIEALKAKAMVNLASNEYAGAIDPDGLGVPVITPFFKEYRNGAYKFISFSAKKARGLMAAHIIRNRILEPEEMKDFDRDGYRFNPSLSTSARWVFTRQPES